MAQEMTTTTRQDIAQGGNSGEATRSGFIYRPSIDICEDDEHVILVADMPGVRPEDVDITLERRVLTIRGRIHLDRAQGYRLISAEYGEGDFERVFTISQEIDRDRIDASHKNGLLTLKLPKAAAAKTRRIDVKAA